MSHFQPLVVVFRGSDTQLRVGGNSNYLIYHFMVQHLNGVVSFCVFIR